MLCSTTITTEGKLAAVAADAHSKLSKLLDGQSEPVLLNVVKARARRNCCFASIVTFTCCSLQAITTVGEAPVARQALASIVPKVDL